MVEAFIYESLEQEEGVAQSQQMQTQHQQGGNGEQSQSQGQQGVNGVQQQTQVQKQSQANGENPMPMTHHTRVPFHKIVTMLLVFVFLAITFLTETSSGSVSKKLALMISQSSKTTS